MHQHLEPKPARNTVYWGVLVCTVGALFYCYEFVLRIVPGVLQTDITQAFGNISATTFGQISALYYFAYSPMQIPVGMLMDRFGPRKLLILACLCCTLGTWLFTHTDFMWLAGSGRFLMGFGSSFAFVGVLSLAVNWLPRQYFSLVAGLITTLGMLGLIYGELKITALAANFGWQYVLYLMVSIGIVISSLAFIFVKDGPQGQVINKKPLENFLTEVTQVLFSSEVWLIGIVGAFLYTSLSVFGELWGKNYLIQAHNLTEIQAARAVAAMFLGWAVGAPLAGYISDKTGRRVILLMVGAILACVCISIILYVPGVPYSYLSLLLFLYGVFSSTEIIIFIMAKEYSGAKLSGTVFAAANMIVTLGGVVFQPLVGKLLDLFNNTSNGAKHIYSATDYQLALSILPISLLLVLVLGFFLKELHKES